MNTRVKEIIKNMVDENVVAFKENTSKILYEKTGKKIETMYQSVAKKLLHNVNENSQNNSKENKQ
jgi:hypothetical protein